MTHRPSVLRTGLVRMWTAFLGAPRALWALAVHSYLKLRLRQRHAAVADPAVVAAAKQVAKVAEPLLVRYCLVDAAGKKVELEGAPGVVALFAKYGTALARRRKGEQIRKVLVPASRVQRSTAIGRSARLTSGVLLMVAALGVALG